MKRGIVIIVSLVVMVCSSDCFSITLHEGVDSQNPYLEKAGQHFEAGQYDKAIDRLEAMLENTDISNEDKLRGHYLMGLCLEKKKKFTEAKCHFLIAISKGYEPEVKTPLSKIAKVENETYNQAFHSYAQDDFQSAEKTLSNMLEKDIADDCRIAPLFLLARSQVQLDNNAVARQTFTEILKIDKHYSPDPATMTENELDLFWSTKQRYNQFWPTMKRNWPYVAGGAVLLGLIIGLAAS